MESIDLASWKWDSKDQEHFALGFLKWARDRGATGEVTPCDLFLMERLSDAHKSLVETMSEQITMLQNEIISIRRQIQ